MLNYQRVLRFFLDVATSMIPELVEGKTNKGKPTKFGVKTSQFHLYTVCLRPIIDIMLFVIYSF